MSHQVLININNLSKGYPVGLLKRKTVLKDVSFHVVKGEVFGIVGVNGAGKSTLIKTITNFLRPCSGTIRINGLKPDDASSRNLIGFLPENPCLYQNLTIIDHFKFIGKVHGLDAAFIEKRGNFLLLKVRLSDAERTPIRKFSKGMIQRAALACALFTDPEILILDEPMSGLDPLGRKLAVDIIREYHELGKTILFCSHILTDVERMCDRIGIMDEGKMKEIISAEDIDSLVKRSETGKYEETPLESYFLRTIKDQAA